MTDCLTATWKVLDVSKNKVYSNLSDLTNTLDTCSKLHLPNNTIPQ